MGPGSMIRDAELIPKYPQDWGLRIAIVTAFTLLGASNINASLDPKHCKLTRKFNLEGHGSSQIDPPEKA